MIRFLNSILITSALLLISCGKGIEPDLSIEEIGFSGTIIFEGTWPEDITATHIVLFKNPLLTESDFSPANLKYVSEEIPAGTTMFKYSTLQNALLVNLQPGDYAYLAVAQTKEPTIILERRAWFIIGIFGAGSNTSNSGVLTLKKNKFTEHIDIVCDFNNPPPQPPGEFK